MPEQKSRNFQYSQWLAGAMRTAGLDIDRQRGGGRKTLADAVGVSMSTVGRWLEGMALPSPEYLQAIADAVRVPALEMLTESGILTASQAPTVKGQSVPEDSTVVPFAARPNRSTGHTDSGQQDTFERTPPQDLGAEQSTLGGMLLSKDAIRDVAEVLKPGDYYRPTHELIHCAILDLHGRGEPADPITVAGELTKRGELQRVGGPGYLHTLVNCIPTAANAAYYAEIVRKKAVLRRLIEVGTRIVGMGYAEEGEIEAITATAVAEVAAAQNDAQQGENSASASNKLTEADRQAEENELTAPLSFIMEDVLNSIEQVGEKAGSALLGLPTGFADLDRLTSGLTPGTLTVLASRPGMGRTTLLTNICGHVAVTHGQPVLTFTLEESREELSMRLLSAEARVPLVHMRTGRMTDDGWTRVAKRMPDVTGAPLHVNDKPRMTAAYIAKQARRMVEEQGVKLIAIDGIQSVRPHKRSDLREREVGDVVRDLKTLARELNVPVLATAQLNRNPEERADGLPKLDDLRESGAITFEADTIVLVHRPDYYEKGSPRVGEADLYVAKNRQGQTGVAVVAFQGHYGRFVDMASDAT